MKWFKAGPKKVFIHGGGKIGLHDWKTKAELYRESVEFSRLWIECLVKNYNSPEILICPPVKRFTRLTL